MLPPAFAAELTAPPATPPALAAVFVTAPTAPPAADVTPPSAPRPPAIPDPAAEAPIPPIVSMSDPAAEAPVCAAAIAWIPTLNGISSPLFRIALSNTIPNAEVDTDALPDACACVWPACTDAWLLLCAPACAPVCGWAAALMQKNAPTTNAIPARFMVVRPP